MCKTHASVLHMDTTTPQTTAAQYKALVIASTSRSATIPASLGPDLTAKGYAAPRGDGTYRITLAGMTHVGY